MSRFAKARADAGAKPKTTRKKAAKPEYTIKGLKDYSAVRDAIKALEGLEETLKADVHDQITSLFVQDGITTHSQPVNFNGLDVGATGSCQLRKRSTRSSLKPAEIELLKEHGIEMEESADTVFYINKAYEADEALMDRVSDALDAAGVPEDFLKSAAPRMTTTTNSIRQAFEGAESKDDLTALLEVVAVIATRVKYEGSVSEALTHVAAMMDDGDDD